MDSEIGANIPTIKVYSDKFSGHVAVLTGAAQGIGAVTAQLFAQQGAQVILLDIQEELLRKVQSLIQSRGGKASYLVCDITDERQVHESVDSIIRQYQRIDVLANIAGIYLFDLLNNMMTESYRRMMSVNLDASFYLTRAVLPHMQRSGYGRIIHTSSSTFQEPEPGLAVYAMSKAAIIGLVRGTSVEAGPGVTVNAVMPGLIKTDQVWNAGVQPDGSHPLFERVIAKQDVKRCGTRDDVAHTFCFIASPEASFISGQIFDVSGGETFH
ncbi:hypothetical protein N7463_007448 [Penicillium fimorum]|uniref:Short-chain dehydrogenase/reductase SDR n=1 Tax=Penicillium fimorum TaxID=1882269 RepID=A0A9X0C708_9EURO|nr:hypothetical protein N7463_007448 [Penicillium fimorum]